MSFEIDSLNHNDYGNFAFWALETGLWGGRPVTWKDAPAFLAEVEARLHKLLFSPELNSTDFNKITASLAWVGAQGRSRAMLAKEIELLRLTSEGRVIAAKHKHDKEEESFWKKHKTAIIIGIVTVAVVATIVIVTVTTGGTGAGAVAAAGGAAINSIQDALEEDRPRREPSPIYPPPISASPDRELPQVTPALEPPLEAMVLPALTDSFAIDAQIPIQSKPGLQTNLTEFQNRNPLLQPSFDPNWTLPPIVSFNPYRIPDPSPLISDSPTPISEFPSSESPIKTNLQNIGSAIVHQTIDGIHGLGSVVPQLLEEIKTIGNRFLPESINAGGEEITPLKNYEEFFNTVHETIDQFFSTKQAELYTEEGKEAREWFDVGILPPPGIFTKITVDINRLTEAGKALDRAGFTKAGRGLMKHGYREGSSFPKPTGNPAQVNEQGQKILESFLNHPEKVVYERPHPDFGKVIEVAVPGKGGVRFTANGEMIGFLEP